METIRARLTAWYSTALALTLATFAIVLYFTRRTASFQDLDQRIASEAELTAGILTGVFRAGGAVVQRTPDRRLLLSPELLATLEAVPDFLIVTTPQGEVLGASADAQALTFGEFEQLRSITGQPRAVRATGTLRIDPTGPTVHYVVLPLRDAGPQVGALFAGASIASAELGPRQLLSTLLLILVPGLALAVLVGMFISDRALAPVNQIIEEVREISDGRSLHRRLPVPMQKDELGRLAVTLNQMMGRLERSFASLHRFTADASHELKTPLTVVRAGVERAITTPHLPRETLEVLAETLQETKRMAELVDALLTLARADEGIAPLHREPVDLRALLRDTQETGELLAEQAGVAMQVVTPDAAVVLDVDKSRVRQLVLNLLENAVKYTPRGGSVRVTLGGGEDGKVTISVSDSGIGIAPGDLPHIFDRFWRADAARTRTGERSGAGLGLAICKWIAEAHGGRIDVTSRPGRGTTFTVTLLATAHPAVTTP
jgi:heavy metal sensor kinase